MKKPARRAHRHVNFGAFVVHRISGLCLAAFLPVHFLALSLALDGEARLDEFIGWTEHPLVKLAETVLVLLLAAHLAGGVRLLAIEFLPWRQGQRTMVAVTAGVALAAGLLYLLNAV